MVKIKGSLYHRIKSVEYLLNICWIFAIYLLYTAKTFEYDHEDQNSDLVKHLAKISETVAKVVFEKVGDKSQTIQFNADTTLINDLIQCYTVSPQCELFASVSI